MGRQMSFDFGLEKGHPRRKNRWLFKIEGISAQGNNALPPSKAARPNLTFKEMEAQHLNETIFFPSKPEWKPITLTLYEPFCGNDHTKHPVFEWLKKGYDPKNGNWKPALDNQFKIDRATLELYDGCGNTLETWVFEGVWPQGVEFGELDMGSSEVITCDLTLRYDRAWIE